MKSILFCCHRSSLFTAQQLIKNGSLRGVVVPESVPDFAEEMRVFTAIAKVDFIVVSQEDMEASVTEWIASREPDVLITNTFSYKIPSQVLEIAKYGGWNFHCGPLPQHRGSIPIFWQLAQGDEELTMSLHKMVDKMDAGPVFSQKRVEVESFDTHDVALNRVAQKAPEMLEELFDALESGNLKLTEQDESQAKYYKKPGVEEITIHWESMTSKEIMGLVRACNLVANGAIAYFRAIEVRIYEVEAISVTDPPKEDAGTVATIPNDPSLYILCKDAAIVRVNVLGMPEAVCSGVNFKKMLGVTSGEKFSSSMQGT